MKLYFAMGVISGLLQSAYNIAREPSFQDKSKEDLYLRCFLQVGISLFVWPVAVISAMWSVYLDLSSAHFSSFALYVNEEKVDWANPNELKNLSKKFKSEKINQTPQND